MRFNAFLIRTCVAYKLEARGWARFEFSVSRNSMLNNLDFQIDTELDFEMIKMRPFTSLISF